MDLARLGGAVEQAGAAPQALEPERGFPATRDRRGVGGVLMSQLLAGPDCRVERHVRDSPPVSRGLAGARAPDAGGLDLVVGQLDRTLAAVRDQDVELAGLVIVDNDRIDGRYLEVHQGLLSLLVRQAPVAGDLRIIVALLHIIRCIERMGDQCVNIAKLVPLSADSAPKDEEILDAIEGMGQLARHLGTETQTSGSRAARDVKVLR